MAYTVMLWLVNPGPQTDEQEAKEMLDKRRAQLPGAKTGVTEPPASTRLVYGVYDGKDQAEEALISLEGLLEVNRPVRVEMGSGNVFLVPASRVHYAVMSEVMRPMDSGKGSSPAV